MKRILSKLMLVALFGFIAFSTVPTAEAALISPPYNDEVYTPGNSYTGSFTVFFTDQDPDVLYLSMAKVEVDDVTAAKHAIFIPADENTLANWVGLDRVEVHKPAGATFTNGDNGTTVNFVVDVPLDAPPGTHHAAAIISNVPNEVQLDANGNAIETGLGVGADLTYQFIALVDGDITYQTSLNDFRTKDRQWLFAHLPVDFETVFQNGGNVHVIPRGNIEIFQGGKIGNVSLNPSQLRVFPGKSRLYENVWSEEGIEDMESQSEIQEARAALPDTFFEHVLYEVQHFRIGQFTASLQGFAGNQPAFGGEVTFWVIPWHLLLVILVIVVFLILLWIIRKKLRGANYIAKGTSKYNKAKKAK